MKNPYHIDIEISGEVNGKAITGKGVALGDPEIGKYNINYRFDQEIGNLDFVIASWTSCGTGDAPMKELNGGKNLLSLSGGNYNFSRVIDFGKRGKLFVEFQVTTTAKTIRGIGQFKGSLDLPRLTGLLPVKSIYKQLEDGKMSAVSRLYYISEDNEIIEANVQSKYDFVARTRALPYQMRISAIDVKRINDYQVHLDWFTTVEGLDSIEDMKNESSSIAEGA